MRIPWWGWSLIALALGLILVIVACVVQARVYSAQDVAAKTRLHVPLAVPLHSLRQHEALYAVLGKTLSVLREAGIDAWACAGTALGLERHGEVIPWDDDADLCVWEADVERVKAAPWAQAGLRLHPYPLAIQVHAVGVEHGPAVDLFFVRQRPDGQIEYAEPITRMTWPRERFASRDAVYPLQPRRLGPLTVPAARDNVAYLQRAYSPSCLTEARYHVPHLLPMAERMLIAVNPWIPKQWPIVTP